MTWNDLKWLTIWSHSLVLFQIGCLVSSLLMLVFRASESALWMGTSTFGLFMSNVFPTSVALAEQYFNVTGLLITDELGLVPCQQLTQRLRSLWNSENFASFPIIISFVARTNWFKEVRENWGLVIRAQSGIAGARGEWGGGRDSGNERHLCFL